MFGGLWASLLEQDSFLTRLFWCLDSGLRKCLPEPDGRSERARQSEEELKSEEGREGEKQNERLATGVNCLSHQTDFLIP